jgi:hypothetical protein
MRRYRQGLFVITFMTVLYAGSLYAQERGDDNPEINSNVGITVNAPVSNTSDVINIGWGIAAGVGYNMNRRNAFVGEFQWNRLYANSQVLLPLSSTLTAPTNLSAFTDLFYTTANYRFELRGRLLGSYVIGGVGWYHRSSNLSQPIASGSGTVCTPAWQWWGFNCVSGFVSANQILATSSSSSFGVNGGIGATVRVAEAPYRLYFESRYHYAPNTSIKTEFIQVTFGIRY